MIKKINSFICDDSGVVSIEMVIVFFSIFCLVAIIYEGLKFQNDMSLMYLNERLATNQVDLMLLDGQSNVILDEFIHNINYLHDSSYFNSLDYSNFSLSCSGELSVKEVACDKNAKLIRIKFDVTRLYTSKFINDLLSLPKEFNREVVLVDDYYK